MNNHLIHLNELVESYRTTMKTLLTRPKATWEISTRAMNTLENFEDHVRDHERALYRLAVKKVLTASGFLNPLNEDAILKAIDEEVDA